MINQVYDAVDKYAVNANRLLLGLVMLVPGLMKLGLLAWVSPKLGGSPAMISGMLNDLGFPAAGFLAWVLIVAEVVCGVAILVNYNVRNLAIPPAIILIAAAFTAHLQGPMFPNVLVHVALASNYLILAKVSAAHSMNGKQASVQTKLDHHSQKSESEDSKSYHEPKESIHDRHKEEGHRGHEARHESHHKKDDVSAGNDYGKEPESREKEDFSSGSKEHASDPDDQDRPKF